MEPDWDKIRKDPEQNYKVEGFYLLDQVARIGDLQQDLNTEKAARQEAEEKLRSLETRMKTQSQTSGVGIRAQGQANEELKEQIKQLKAQIKQLIDFFNEIAEIEPAIITKVKSKIDITEIIKIIREYR